jgi:starch synthase
MFAIYEDIAGERQMRVLFVAAEFYPLAKTGGLADVSSALPHALAARGVDARVLLPGYPGALAAAIGKRVAADLGDALGLGRTRLIAARAPDSGLPIWLVECPALYHRAGGLYQDAQGNDWQDNALRFGLLCRVAAVIARGEAGIDWLPDVVHGNDWHAGLAAAMIAGAGGSGRRAATLFTIHNMAFQGVFPREALARLALPEEMFSTDGFEYYGQASFLKAGIRYSDRLTAVSPSYGREILTPEYGFGLEGLLQARAGALEGILNGIDHEVWTPSTDENLPVQFDREDLAAKGVCKAVVQRELGLEVAAQKALITFVSRLTWQKMADLLPEVVPALVERGAQFALVGEGEPAVEATVGQLRDRYPGSVHVRIGYDERLEHRLHAAGDILLAPARFEPCGLSQLYAMRYGAVPVVRRTGGLADSVVNADDRTLAAGTATGFTFDEPTPAALLAAVDRALVLYRQPLTWRRVQLRAMAGDFGWGRSAERYVALYNEMTGGGVSRPVPVAMAEIVPANEGAPVTAANRQPKRKARASA